MRFRVRVETLNTLVDAVVDVLIGAGVKFVATFYSTLYLVKSKKKKTVDQLREKKNFVLALFFCRCFEKFDFRVNGLLHKPHEDLMPSCDFTCFSKFFLRVNSFSRISHSNMIKKNYIDDRTR